MAEKQDGGPAFPQSMESWCRVSGNTPVPSGMSLRDWFAGQALGGIAGTAAIYNLLIGIVEEVDKQLPPGQQVSLGLLGLPAISPTIGSESAYKWADAMLAERAKEGPRP